jgi:ABC-type bacteriocin/lantibiotic exporter with double-glycine peptidase domain
LRKALALAVSVGLMPICCARNDLAHLERRLSPARETRHYIPGVPFFPQSKHQCGPASLASVLNYYGCPITPEEIAEKIYEKRLKGSLGIDLLLYAQRMGFSAKAYRGTLTDLKDHVSKGQPLIVFQDLGYPPFPVRHFSVIIGYDEGKGVLILYSGKQRDKVTSYGRFLRSWREMDYWTLLILPS